MGEDQNFWKWASDIPGLAFTIIFAIGSASSAYLYGLTKDLGTSFFQLLDATSFGSSLAIAVLFGVYFWIIVRLGFLMLWLSYIAGRQSARTEIKLNPKILDDQARPTRRSQLGSALVQVLSSILLCFVLLASTYSIALKGFLDPASYAKFLISVTAWILTGLFMIGFAHPENDEFRFFNQAKKSCVIVVQSINAPNKLLSAPFSIPIIFLIALIAFYEVGKARYSTLTHAAPICIITDDNKHSVSIIAQTMDTYLAYSNYLDPLNSGGAANTGTLLGVPKKQVLLIRPTCKEPNG